MIPAATDNSKKAQAVRVAAVKAVGCPKCGAPIGFACKTTKGGNYNARFNVHVERLRAASIEEE
jgi:hypothetical protein